MHSFDQQYQQHFQEQKSQLQLKQQYWLKWLQWVDMVRKQRYNAVKLFQHQNLLEERLKIKTFKAWFQVSQQEKFQQLLRLKNSFHQNQMQRFQEQNTHIKENPTKPNPSSHKQLDDDLAYKITLAIRFHQRKTYAKCIASWISYGIHCKKLEQSLSKVYIKYLLHKYFQIIHEFKCKSIDKKAKKAITVINSPKKQDQSSLNAHSQMNLVTPANLISQIDRFPATAQNFRQALHQNTTFKRTQQHQPQTKTLYTGFQRNSVMGQSRRSQFSTLSAQMDYHSKRKFRPITQLPSIPDLENIQKKIGSNDRPINKQPTKSPIKSYRRQEVQGSRQLSKGYSVSNLSESNLTELNQNPQTKLKTKILSALINEKLLTLAIMKGDEFQEGLEYENYRQKTVNGLRKLRDVKIR